MAMCPGRCHHRQRLLTLKLLLFSVVLDFMAVYSYALRFSHQVNDDARSSLYRYVRERGDVSYVIGVDEIGDASERIHFHAVIRTKIAKHKKDENVFQAKGRLAKCLQERVGGFKPVSFVAVKTTWEQAVSYAVKEGYVEHGGFDFDHEAILERAKDAKASWVDKKKKTSTISSTLMEVWEEAGRPMKYEDIFMAIVGSPKIRWNNDFFAGYERAANHVYKNVNLEFYKAHMLRRLQNDHDRYPYWIEEHHEQNKI